MDDNDDDRDSITAYEDALREALERCNDDDTETDEE